MTRRHLGGAAATPIDELGSPRFKKTTINICDKYYGSKTFVIEAKNESQENRYIHSALLNGKKTENLAFSTKRGYQRQKISSRNGEFT